MSFSCRIVHQDAEVFGKGAMLVEGTNCYLHVDGNGANLGMMHRVMLVHHFDSDMKFMYTDGDTLKATYLEDDDIFVFDVTKTHGVYQDDIADMIVSGELSGDELKQYDKEHMEAKETKFLVSLSMLVLDEPHEHIGFVDDELANLLLGNYSLHDHCNLIKVGI